MSAGLVAMIAMAWAAGVLLRRSRRESMSHPDGTAPRRRVT